MEIISRGVEKILLQENYQKSGKNFSKAVEYFDDLEKRNLVERRGYSIASKGEHRVIKYNKVCTENDL